MPQKRRGLRLPLVIIRLHAETPDAQDHRPRAARYRDTCTPPGRLGARWRDTRRSPLSGPAGLARLMRNPRIGRARDAVSHPHLEHVIPVPKQTPPFEHDEHLVGHQMRMRRTRAVPRRHPPGVHAEPPHAEPPPAPPPSSPASTRDGNAPTRPARRPRAPAPYAD